MATNNDFFNANSRNNDNDGRMTHSQKERLFDWHEKEANDWFDEQLEADPTFKAAQEAINQADALCLEIFEVFLAGDVADNALSDVNEQDWLATALSGDNLIVRGLLKDEGLICGTQASVQRLQQGIEILKIVRLWPW